MRQPGTDVGALVAVQRAELAALLTGLGPDAPTLCEGWSTRDLAAHLVVRERRPDTLPGIVAAPLGRWTEQVRRRQAARPYPDTVRALRDGPPPWSPFALPGAAAGNLTELFVHAEDARRGSEGWTRRELDPAYRAALWRALTRVGPGLWRRARVGVVLLGPGGERRRVHPGEPAVTLSGPPEELLLHGFGRTAAAQVDVDGPAQAVADYRGTPLGV